MAGAAEKELEARQLSILRRVEELSSRLAQASAPRPIPAGSQASVPDYDPAREDGSGAGAGVGRGRGIQERLEAELRSRGVSDFRFTPRAVRLLLLDSGSAARRPAGRLRLAPVQEHPSEEHPSACGGDRLQQPSELAVLRRSSCSRGEAEYRKGPRLCAFPQQRRIP